MISKEWWESVTDDDHSGWPLNVACGELNEQINQRAGRNQRISTDETSPEISIKYESKR
jgi:hypothetical protein